MSDERLGASLSQEKCSEARSALSPCAPRSSSRSSSLVGRRQVAFSLQSSLRLNVPPFGPVTL